jgi:hypothetical protein
MMLMATALPRESARDFECCKTWDAEDYSGHHRAHTFTHVSRIAEGFRNCFSSLNMGHRQYRP